MNVSSDAYEELLVLQVGGLGFNPRRKTQSILKLTNTIKKYSREKLG